MAPAAPFNPPSADLPGKPFVPEWVPPPVTKEKHNFAELKSIDLSLLDSEDPAVVDDLVQQVKVAIRNDGFLFLENYGVSLEQLHRQFALAQYLYNNISEEDKERLLFHPDSGKWSGYKHPYGFKRHRGAPDGIEQFNWYKPDWEDINRVPTCLHPFMDEIEAFSNYLTKSVNRRLLTVLSRVLELPDDYLWDNVQSHGSPTGEGYFRHALFRPVQKQTQEASKGLRMHGHTDFGLTTLLFSVPISCLQIWGRDEQWYYVPYKPGALVINIGDTLEIVSGGHFKATRHRVFRPPADQLHEERLSLVLFNSSIGDLRMAPAQDSKLIQREGCVEEQGVYKEFKKLTSQGKLVPTNRQWREIQIATCTDPTDTVNNRVGAHQVLIDGKVMHQREYMGVKVVLPDGEQHNQTFEQYQEHGSQTHSAPISTLSKGAHVVIRGRPYRISKIDNFGTSIHLVAEDIFTGTTLEDDIESTQSVHIPTVWRKEYELVDIDEGFLNLIAQDGMAKDDVKVPDGEIGKQIQQDFDAGKNLIITVLSAMGEEQAISGKEADKGY
ncbi:gibberellin 3-beta hydroxylase [Aspergillus arachidicola]|uniref:Gibberellin 3-beta hydroxylase n=1 Tax=Aspergillus arachidicola TaxID=656916 RepID=A0A2G7G162_9EURO|nr:gibberellin 3-beta hydroxylase [Aspergillus arachidicola]